MDRPQAAVASDTVQAVPRQQRRRRGSRLVEFTLHFAISYAILSLLRFEPMARNSVQDHNYGIDLPSKPETSGEGVHQISTRSTRTSGKQRIYSVTSQMKHQEINNELSNVESIERPPAGGGPSVEKPASSDIDSKFCGHYKWLNTQIKCTDRLSFLVNNHHMSVHQAKIDLLEQNCECNSNSVDERRNRNDGDAVQQQLLQKQTQSTGQLAVVGQKTKIVAITDINYASNALEWHNSLVSLGYNSSQLVVVVADDASLQYFNSSNLTEVRVEPLLHKSSIAWPVADPKMKKQIRKRRLFATRWVYVLQQLRMGYSVLLSDADNIFVRYLDMAEFENSSYDVIHAYCHNFPIRFLSMGFVVCGGMMWLRGNDDPNEDGPAVRYVLSILEQCRWQDSGLKYPLAATCDDQQVINSKFFTNSLNYTWVKRPEEGFWKEEAWGESLVTGHKFGFWSVDVAYRGPVDGIADNESKSDNSNHPLSGNAASATMNKQCPNKERSWVAMPYTTIQTSDKKLDASADRSLRIKQWYQFCRNETNMTVFT